MMGGDFDMTRSQTAANAVNIGRSAPRMASSRRLAINVSTELRPTRQLAVSGTALVALTAASWLALAGQYLRNDSAGAFLVGWLVMMAAMMLPAAAPMIFVVRVAITPGRLADLRTGVFVAGYLLVWTALGLAVLMAQSVLAALGPASRAWAAAAILALAGAYQFSALKNACLRACRSPMDFIVLHWRSGADGIFRLGIAHGLYCIGCCWALMAVLVIAGGMGLAWVALIALVVFAEKVLPGARFASRATGAVMLAAAVLIALSPELRLLAAAPM
jgi:predicted metal-binding membrane protein